MNKKMSINKNLFKLLKGFKDKWVAITPDYREVVSSGDTLEEAESKVKEKERGHVIFYKVVPPPFVSSNS